MSDDEPADGATPDQHQDDDNDVPLAPSGPEDPPAEPGAPMNPA